MNEFKHLLSKSIVTLLCALTLNVHGQSEIPTYKVKYRLSGRISYAYPHARSSSQAKEIVEARIGPSGTILSATRADQDSDPLPKYKVKFRLNGKLSYGYVKARNSSQAKQIMEAQIGSNGKVLEAQRSY